MRLHWIALLAAATLIGTTNALHDLLAKKLQQAQGDTTYNRFLRSVDTADADDNFANNVEERGVAGVNSVKAEAAKKLKVIMQLDDWFGANKKPEDVYGILGLNGGTKAFGTPEFKMYVRYKHYYDKQQPLLVPKLSDEEAKVLDQFRKWFRAKLKPEQVFKELGLEGLGTKVFAMDEFKIYKEYTRYYHKNQPLILPK